MASTLYKALIKNKRFVFNKLFSINKRNKQEVITAFSGLLELSRRRPSNPLEFVGNYILDKAKKNK